MNESIIKDIYTILEKLNDGPIDLSEEEIDKTGEAIKEALRHWSTPKPTSEFTVRMSNLGKPLRQLWFDKKKQKHAERIPAHTFIKFLYGHLMEEIVLMFVRMAGYEVTDQQKEVDLKGIKGHIDCKINGEIVDVKTASNFAFKKFADGSLHENDTFGYLMQLAAYEAAEKSEQGGFLAINKESGQLAYYSPFDVFKPNPNKKIDNILKVLEEDTPPEICYQPVAEGKQGNMRLDKTCVYCSHKRECWRDANGGQGLRAFKYANGVKYFTRVSSLPKVDEIPLL